MADETTEKTEETQSQADSQAAGTEKEGQGEESQKEDWEGKYKASQTEHQKTVEERDHYRDTLDTVYPAVDFSKLQGEQQGEEGEKPALTQEDLDRHSQKIDNKLITIDFRQKHPELREYEAAIVGPAIARIRRANPRMALDKVLDKAAEETQAFLETEREKGRAEAGKKKEEAAAAGGLGAAGGASIKKEAPEGESNDDYIASRRKTLETKRGYG